LVCRIPIGYQERERGGEKRKVSLSLPPKRDAEKGIRLGGHCPEEKMAPGGGADLSGERKRKPKGRPKKRTVGKVGET